MKEEWFYLSRRNRTHVWIPGLQVETWCSPWLQDAADRGTETETDKLNQTWSNLCRTTGLQIRFQHRRHSLLCENFEPFGPTVIFQTSGQRRDTWLMNWVKPVGTLWTLWSLVRCFTEERTGLLICDRYIWTEENWAKHWNHISPKEKRAERNKPTIYWGKSSDSFEDMRGFLGLRWQWLKSQEELQTLLIYRRLVDIRLTCWTFDLRTEPRWKSFRLSEEEVDTQRFRSQSEMFK